MKVCIVGAGATGLFCAYHLVKDGIEVELFEKEPSIAKKLLIAGKSGLNITSNYPIESFSKMYFEHDEFFNSLLAEYGPEDTKAWLQELGFESFVGSSYKVFPREFKAASLVKKLKDFLVESEKFSLHTNKKLTDFNNDFLYFEKEKIKYEKAIFCFGGASWKETGSDGRWLNIFQSKGIETKDFEASNCGFFTEHKAKERIPLKNIRMKYQSKELFGESMLTKDGIEGGVLYHLSSMIRDGLNEEDCIFIDFLPHKSNAEIKDKLDSLPAKMSWGQKVKKVIKLNPMILVFIKDSMTKEEYFDPEFFIHSVKSFKLKLLAPFAIDKAISTSGGVMLSELSKDLNLKSHPKIYLGGEMLNWEAPTGGFLLQGCFSMGKRITEDIKKASI